MTTLAQVIIIAAWGATLVRHSQRLVRLSGHTFDLRSTRVRAIATRIWWWLGREEFWRGVAPDALRAVQVTALALILPLVLA